MKNALEQMLEKSGLSRVAFTSNSRIGSVFSRRGVPDTTELRRVAFLPRRRWQDDPDLEQLAADMTDWLKTPHGTQTLRPVQAKALEEIHDFRGLFASIRVGGGKTLVTYLAATVLGVASAVVLVPAKLRGKTRREFDALSQHWIRHPRLHIVSYEKLSRDGGMAVLLRHAPALIMADEGHRLKNTNAGCTRKVRQYLKEHKDCTFVDLSGTPTTRSINEYTHRIRWALRDNAPIPKPPASQDWADAIDEKIPPTRRMQPGALLRLCEENEVEVMAKDATSTLSVVRQAFRRRLVETPGVITTEEGMLGVSLSITTADFDLKGAGAKEFDQLKLDWEVPGGEPFTEAMDLWRHCRELACGFVYKWKVPGPDEWLEARRQWARFVREVLGNRYKGIDTEFQVANACLRGRFDATLYETWRDIRPSFEPETIPVWVHDKTLKFAEAWLRKEAGICWVEHRAFGDKLAARTGLPYFAQGGMCGGIPIEEATGPVIASIQSNSEGRNLQRWRSNLLVSPPPNGRVIEQLLGRTHREGQEADEVSAEVCIVCKEQWEGLQQALLDALYVQDTTGQPQKLLYADVEFPTAGDVRARAAEPAWR